MQVAIFIHCHDLCLAYGDDGFRLIFEVYVYAALVGFDIYECDVVL